jgi:hypothetical protein
LRALGDDSPVTPYHDPEELRSFLKAIKSAQTSEEIQSVIQQSEKILKVYSRGILRDADCAFGKLKGEILSRHLGLPDPGWSNSIG